MAYLISHWRTTIGNNALRLILLLIVLLCGSIYANEFDFSYADADGSRVVHIKNSADAMWNDLKIKPMQQFRNSNAGYMVNFNLKVQKDFYNKWDIFFDIDYLRDQMLGIDNQLDMMVGAGYEFYNNYEDRHKISYALVYRATELLHSFRYKFTHEGQIFKSKCIVFYVLPIQEVSVELGTSFVIYKAVSFTINHYYKTVEDKESYFSTAGFKIEY